MDPVLHQYKLRLTNLSQANRSLKLSRLSVRKDIDLLELGHLNQNSAAQILGRIIAGHNVVLIKQLSASDERINLGDRRLNQVFHEISTLNEETGSYDLALGYPFVEGKFLDGSIARCPLVLFPVRLVRNFQGSPRWTLEANTDEDLSFNTTFFLAYEKFMQVRLSKEFWEDKPERHGDVQGFLNGLYKQLQLHEVQLHFNSNLFQFDLEAFLNKNQALLDELPIGKLRSVPNAILGIFPQSDSALLQDYEVLERQPNVFSIEQLLKTRHSTLNLDAIREDDRYFVTPIDQTQEEALLRVRQGDSIVLHGPPGTGKSQVILNLISDALARGKKVLVCSQKRAALDVVFDRMNETGLGRFAALVHDYRADRNKIFERVRRQIDDIEQFEKERRDLGIDQWLHEFRRDSRKLDENSQFYEGLYQALTQRGRFGLSAHELYQLANTRAAAFDMYAVAHLIDHAGWQEFKEKLSSILDYSEFFAAEHPWRFRIPTHRLGYPGKSALRQALSGLPAEMQTLHQQWDQLQGPGKSLADTASISELLRDFVALENLIAQPSAKEDLSAAISQSLKVKFLQTKLDAFGKLLEKMAAFRVVDGLPLNLHPDMEAKLAAYEAEKLKPGRYFSLAWLKGWWYVRQLLRRRDRKVLPAEVKLLKAEVDTMGKALKLAAELEAYTFFSDMPIDRTVSDMYAWHSQKLRNLDVIVAWMDFGYDGFRPKIVDGRFDEAYWQVQVSDARILEAIQRQLMASRQRWKMWLHDSQANQLVRSFDVPEEGIAFAQQMLKSFDQNFDDLVALDTLLEGLTPNERAILEPLESEFTSAEDKSAFLGRVANGFYQAWISLTEAQHPGLLEVSSRQMPARQQAYQTLVSNRAKTVAGLILRKLKDEITQNIDYNRLQNPVTYRDLGHQVRKQRQLWPVRKLVQTFWHEGLSRLIPCWMASPESVAAIFPMEKDYFDLVIFDEASQCYVERALPVMLRGRQCVIAGDDKQLPPFDLYNVKVDESEDGIFEDEMALEVESILDLSRNVFTDCKLSWHYRSAEEELINFSNYAFYEGRLQIIPPAQHTAISRPPIEWVRVEGIWENNRNLVEAEAIVALVEDFVQRPENPTIGIVTFNFHQKELIRSLLEMRLESLGHEGNSQLSTLLHKAMVREEGEERSGIFVKNIENVQGDERDVIIFSIGYAPDAKGKMVAHFGLLNQKGGENRLNVAITRARKKVIVVSSIEPEALAVDGAKHEGPRLFRRYLQFARAISRGEKSMADNLLQQIAGSTREQLNPATFPWASSRALATRVQALLEEAGLQVQRDIGDTHYKLDLAVLGSNGDFLIGIECEGRNYFNGKTAKEREVYRPVALQQRGWRIYRLWARNFWMNPEGEIAQIVAMAKETPSK
jgi:very-short-patch-repair endonuclease